METVKFKKTTNSQMYTDIYSHYGEQWRGRIDFIFYYCQVDKNINEKRLGWNLVEGDQRMNTFAIGDFSIEQAWNLTLEHFRENFTGEYQRELKLLF